MKTQNQCIKNIVIAMQYFICNLFDPITFSFDALLETRGYICNRGKAKYSQWPLTHTSITPMKFVPILYQGLWTVYLPSFLNSALIFNFNVWSGVRVSKHLIKYNISWDRFLECRRLCSMQATVYSKFRNCCAQSAMYHAGGYIAQNR